MATDPREADLAAPKDVLLQAKAVLGAIDLDPYTTPYNNRLATAARIYDLRLHSVDQIATDPWEVPGDGRVFLGVPTSTVTCRRLANKVLREYRAGRVKEAVVWLGNHESLIRLPWVWDFPVCLPFRRAKPRYWDEEAEVFRSICPSSWSFVFYMPPSDTPLAFHSKLSRFHVAFSSIGRVVFDQHSGEGDWCQSYKAAIKKPYDYHG